MIIIITIFRLVRSTRALISFSSANQEEENPFPKYEQMNNHDITMKCGKDKTL